jgi:hypothetical protein
MYNGRVAAMTGRDLDRYMGRAFVGDGVAEQFDQVR